MPNFIRRCVGSHFNKPFPFSLDIIAAVKRQLSFTEKMVNNILFNSHLPREVVLETALDRYMKFIHLMKNKKNMLVPTLGKLTLEAFQSFIL